MDALKQVIIVRSDLEMGKGKAAAQVGHAVLGSYVQCLKAHRDVAEEWMETGQKKIVLKVDTESDLIKFYEAFKFKKIPCSLINDAGLTQLPPGTSTALGVGPWKSDEIDILTRGLKLF
jgi:PTH2 family peptidyl-tRNA hydrolase